MKGSEPLTGEFERKVKWVLDVRKLEDNDRLQLGGKSYKEGVRKD